MTSHEFAVAVLLAVKAAPRTAREIAEGFDVDEVRLRGILRAYETAGVMTKRLRLDTGKPGSKPEEFVFNDPPLWRTFK